MKLNTKLFLLYLMCFPMLNTKAQVVSTDTTGRKFYYEQGINCTQFVKQYLSFNESFSSNMPYLLTGNFGFKSFGLRYGANYQISNSKNTSSGSSNSSFGGSTTVPPSLDQVNSVVVDARLGIYYRKIFFNRLNLNIGLDYLISNADVKTKNESSEISGTFTSTTKSETRSTTKASGYGAFLAVNYRVWRSVSVGTEAALYYVTGSTKEKGSAFNSETPSSPFGTYTFVSQETSGKTTFGDTEIRIPLTLYVYFKF